MTEGRQEMIRMFGCAQAGWRRVSAGGSRGAVAGARSSLALVRGPRLQGQGRRSRSVLTVGTARGPRDELERAFWESNGRQVPASRQHLLAPFPAGLRGRGDLGGAGEAGGPGTRADARDRRSTRSEEQNHRRGAPARGLPGRGPSRTSAEMKRPTRAGARAAPAPYMLVADAPGGREIAATCCRQGGVFAKIAAQKSLDARVAARRRHRLGHLLRGRSARCGTGSSP